ncbi:MAG: hypothetical protein ACR2N6_06525 [Miltoncostaeaceae bacterium]
MPVEIPQETRQHIEELTRQRDAGEITLAEFLRRRMAALEDAGVVYEEERWEPDANVGRTAILLGVVMGTVAFVATAIAVAVLLIG